MNNEKPDIFPEKVDLSSPSPSYIPKNNTDGASAEKQNIDEPTVNQKDSSGPKDAASLKNAEKASEGASDNGLYNPKPKDIGKTRSIKKMISGFSNKKKIAAGALLAGGATGVFFLAGFIQAFQLIHLGEFTDSKLHSQTKRILNKRAAKHYALLINEDGSVGDHYKETKIGKITNIYADLKAENLVKNLKDKGYDIKINEDGKITLNGEVMKGNLADRRSAIRGMLDEAYPDKVGFFHRYKRTQATYKTFGIKRVFFENTKEKIGNYELYFIKKLRERMKSAGGSVNTTPRETEISDTDGAPIDIPELNAQELDAAAQELSSNLDDPAFNPELEGNGAPSTESLSGQLDDVLDPSKAAGRASDVGIGAAKGLAVDGAAQAACEMKAYLKGIELGAKAYRYRALLQYTLPILTAAHQLKTGEGVTSAQIGGILAILNRPSADGKGGIGSSGAMQLLSGNKAAQIKNTDRYSLTFTDGAGGVLSKINQVADKISGVTPGTEYCKLARSGWYQAGSIVVGIGAAILPTGATQTNLVYNVGAGIVKSILISIIGELVKPLFVSYLAGAAFNGYESGDKVGDALSIGAGIMASSQRYKMGGTAKTFKQTAEIEQIIAAEKKEDLKTMSVYNKYFALNNPDSYAFNTIMSTPSNPRGMAIAGIQNAAKIANPLNYISKQVLAEDNSVNGEDSGIAQLFEQSGVTNYSLSDAEVDALPGVIESEKWLVANNKMQDYKNWVNQCHPSDSDTLIAEGLALSQEDEDAIKQCKEDPNVNYYTAYYLDRGIATQLAFELVASDCMDPDDDNAQCAFDDGKGPSSGASNSPTTPSAGTAVLSTGTNEEVIQELLNNPNINWADPDAKADIQSVIDPQLRKVILSLAQSSGHKIVITDLYRPAANDFHGSGLAIDIDNDSKSGPNYDPKSDELFKYIYDNREVYKINELIWADQPDGTNCIDSPKPGEMVLKSCIELFGPATTQQHNNHIHISVNR